MIRGSRILYVLEMAREVLKLCCLSAENLPTSNQCPVTEGSCYVLAVQENAELLRQGPQRFLEPSNGQVAKYIQIF